MCTLFDDAHRLVTEVRAPSRVSFTLVGQTVQSLMGVTPTRPPAPSPPRRACRPAWSASTGVRRPARTERIDGMTYTTVRTRVAPGRAVTVEVR
ncbi:hypothetical protein [Streptomyces melanogenes]|uniref:hypothetical protein n=1 Tax=Streptomyces melanogenes TaxID=67326 RepID=UPI00378DF459